MFDLLPPLDMTDPESFAAAAIALFCQYPEDVVERAVLMIPTRSDRPTLRLIKEVCDELLAPIEREFARIAARQSHLKDLPAPRPPRTIEQQLRIDKQVRDARWQIKGRPPSGMLAPVRTGR